MEMKKERTVTEICRKLLEQLGIDSGQALLELLLEQPDDSEEGTTAGIKNLLD